MSFYGMARHRRTVSRTSSHSSALTRHRPASMRSSALTVTSKLSLMHSHASSLELTVKSDTRNTKRDTESDSSLPVRSDGAVSETSDGYGTNFVCIACVHLFDDILTDSIYAFEPDSKRRIPHLQPSFLKLTTMTMIW